MRIHARGRLALVGAIAGTLALSVLAGPAMAAPSAIIAVL